MAILANAQSGDFTSASTWGTVDPVSFLNSTIGTQSTTTAYIETQSFIPGAITIDALAIRISSVSGAGTISVRLALAGVTVPGTEVTINISDLNGTSGFVLFKLAAPVTLIAATSYTLSIRTSIIATAIISRDGTAGNWSRFLRTTTTAAPAATDSLFVLGEFLSAGVNNTLTVTMNNTAASIFALLDICEKGILDAATSTSTNYQLIVNNNINIRPNSLLQIGTLANPIPASSTFLLQLNQSGVNVNFGILLAGNAIFRTYGASKVTKALLAADAAVSATSLTTDVSTGWLSGDEIVIAPTTATITQVDVRTLSANTVGTTLTVPALTFAHGGSGDFVAEILNTSRNIRVKSDSATFGTYLIGSTNCTIDLNYTEFREMGSGTASRRGFDLLNSTAPLTIAGCSFHRFQTSAIMLLLNQNNHTNISISDNVFYNVLNTINGISIGASTATSITVTDNWFVNATCSFGQQGGTVSNLRSSAANQGFSFGANGNTGLTVNNIISHSQSTTGIAITSSSLAGTTYTNLVTWRAVRGLNMNASANVTVQGHIAYGNTVGGISVTNCQNVTVENSTYYGSVTIIQTSGVILESTSFNTVFNNCTFGTPSTHSTGDVQVAVAKSWHDTKFNACLFSSATEVANTTNLSQNAFLGSSRHDQTAGIHRGWKRSGTLNSDAILVATAPLSLRVTPSTLATKTETAVRGFAIPSGLSGTVSVLVRRSVAGDGTAYNGALPRLWLRQNDSAGITSETLLATATAASLGSFESISGTIPPATDNTVNYIYLDCDGTAGWVNVDKATLVIQDGTANSTNVSTEDYWQDGFSFPGVNTTLSNNSNQFTYWLNGSPVSQIYPVSAIQTGKFFLLFD